MKKLVYVRIPRAGSSSLIRHMERVFGVKYVHGVEKYAQVRLHSPNSLWYKDRSKALTEARDGLVMNRQRFEDALVIYGHVPLNVLWPVIPTGIFFTIMREPVEFIISGYYFAKRLKHIPEWMDIYEYARLEYRRNWQSMYVVEPEKFHYICLYERYENDIAMLGERFGWEVPKDYPRLNKGSQRQYYDAEDLRRDRALKGIVKAYHGQDCDLYQRVCAERGIVQPTY